MSKLSLIVAVFGLSITWAPFVQVHGQNPSVVFEQAINAIEGGGIPDLGNGDWFGYAVAPIGDLNQDGVEDLAVGAPYDDDGGLNRGALYILFMNQNGTVNHYQKISQTTGGFQGILVDESFFGSDIANVGDLDSNGVQDLVIGASGDDDGGAWAGALWVLFMNSDGTVLGQQKISAVTGWPNSPVGVSDRVGKGIDSIGDLNSDGVIDIAIGAHEDDDGGNNHGAVYILFLNSNGTVQNHTKISEITPGFIGDLTASANFGWSIACLGDLDGNGDTEILVGAMQDDVLSTDDGSVWVLSVTSNGSLSACVELSAGTSPVLASVIGSGDKFGSAVTRGFSMWCDTTSDIAVGAMNYGNGGEGGVLLLDLDENYQVQNVQSIAEGQSNFQYNLNPGDRFGRAIHLITDYDGNGHPDLMVGAIGFGSSGGTWIVSVDRVSGLGLVMPPDTSGCGPIQLTAQVLTTDPYNANWSNGQSGASVEIQSSGTYYLSVVGACGNVLDSVVVDIYPQSYISVLGPSEICFGDTVTLSANSSDTSIVPIWNTGQSSLSIEVFSQGEYWASLTTNCGILSDTIQLNSFQSSSIDHQELPLACGTGYQLSMLENLVDSLSQGIEYTWSTGENGKSINVYEPGVYWGYRSGYCGLDSVFFEVYFDDCWRQKIPNVITPNLDDFNEVFLPISECNDCNYQLSIYNRWGSRIFNGDRQGWAGTTQNGVAVPSGVYYYVLEFADKTVSGYVQVLP